MSLQLKTPPTKCMEKDSLLRLVSDEIFLSEAPKDWSVHLDWLIHRLKALD